MLPNTHNSVRHITSGVSIRNIVPIGFLYPRRDRIRLQYRGSPSAAAQQPYMLTHTTVITAAVVNNRRTRAYIHT
jgi:hypothetical protein